MLWIEAVSETDGATATAAMGRTSSERTWLATERARSSRSTENEFITSKALIAMLESEPESSGPCPCPCPYLCPCPCPYRPK